MLTANAWYNKQYAYAHSMRMTIMTGGLNYKVVGVVRPPLRKSGEGGVFRLPSPEVQKTQKCEPA